MTYRGRCEGHKRRAQARAEMKRWVLSASSFVLAFPKSFTLIYKSDDGVVRSVEKTIP